MPVTLQPLPPKEAIAYFRSKGLKSSFAWQDTWQEEHATAFTVAKVMRRDILEDIRAAVDAAIADGKTLDQFRAELKPILVEKGWWGKAQMEDPETGEMKTVQLGSNRRLKTIYQVNLRTSYAHGNWQRIERTKTAFPYLMYSAVRDSRTRPQHRAWNGVCLPVDDPWWDTHYPPCGWNCRCSTLSLTKRMMESRGIRVNKPAAFEPVTYVNPRTGEVASIERGIDPGFNYNVGKAPLRQLSAPPAPVAKGVPGVAAKASEEAAKAFLGTFSADAKGQVVTDRDGWPLVISDGMFRDAANFYTVPRPDLIDRLPDVAQTLAKPDTVEWTWAQGSMPEAEVQDNLRAVVAASESGAPKLTVPLSPIARPLIELAKAQGYDLSRSRRVLDTEHVGHIFDQHGNLAKEAARGQIAITAADFARIPEIVAAPDHLVMGGATRGGLPVVAYARTLGAETYVYVEEIRNKAGELAGVTLYKHPATTDVQSITKQMMASASQYVRNGSGAQLPILTDLTSRRKTWRAASQQQLVRRYTKRVDGRLITVDFSRDGWTYDVQEPVTRP